MNEKKGKIKNTFWKDCEIIVGTQKDDSKNTKIYNGKCVFIVIIKFILQLNKTNNWRINYLNCCAL